LSANTDRAEVKNAEMSSSFVRGLSFLRLLWTSKTSFELLFLPPSLRRNFISEKTRSGTVVGISVAFTNLGDVILGGTGLTAATPERG
jgi:hypothetical protein